MEPRQFEEHLGPFDRATTTDTQRIHGMVTSLLRSGALSGVLAVALLVLHDPRNPGFLTWLTVTSLGFAGAMLLVALIRSAQGRRRRGEWFAVYRDGFVHHTARGEQVVPWAQVRKVRERSRRSNGPYSPTYFCVVRCFDGRVFRLNNMTADADWFALTVTRHMAPAADGIRR